MFFEKHAEPGEDSSRTAHFTAAVVEEGSLCCDGGWRIGRLNAAAEELLCRGPEELLGHVLWEAIPGWVGTEVERACRRAMEQRESVSLEIAQPAGAKWCDFRVFPGEEGGICMLFRDITRRRHGAESARRNEDLLRLMFESVKDYAIFSFDPELRVTSWNTGAQRLFGYGEEEIVGRSMALLFTPEDQAAGVPRQEMDSACETGSGDDVRWHMRKDGSRFFVSGKVHPIRDRSGRLLGFTKVAQDITEAWRSQQALERQADLLELSHDAILIWRLDGQITYWNRGAEQLYGFTRDQALGRDPRVLLHTRQRGGPLTFVEELKRVGHWSGELLHHCRDDQAILVESRQVVITTPEGESVVLESNRDITERDKVQSALQEREAQLQLAIAIAQMGTFDLEVASDRVTLNDVGRAIYGFAPGSPLTFARVQNRFNPEDRPEVLRRIQAALDPLGHDGFDCEHRIIRTDGAERWIRVVGKTFFEDLGEKRRALRWMATFTDITRLKETETILRETNRRKDEFLAMLAHELRNPLAAIRNALEVCEAPQSDVDSFEWGKGVIDRQSAQLARLVDDLLDVSRITSGKIRLRKEWLEVGPLLDHATEVVLPLILSRGHELSVDHGADETLWLEGDGTRIEQIVVNLLTNAAKYMESGGKIWLNARREGSEVLLSVRDSGIGIPPERLSEIFELFAQGERSVARSEGGLGVGLTIVRSLAEMHGGTVTARSEGPGRGSEFLVRLPAAEPGWTRPAPANAHAWFVRGEPGEHILVVDDNVDTAEGLSRLLRRKGFAVRAVYDGTAALEVAREFNPRFVLLDIGMPGMDGYEVAARLRAEPTSPPAVLIAVSGYGQDEDQRRSHDAGFDFHLVKPMDVAQLETILAGEQAP